MRDKQVVAPFHSFPLVKIALIFDAFRREPNLLVLQLACGLHTNKAGSFQGKSFRMLCQPSLQYCQLKLFFKECYVSNGFSAHAWPKAH